MTNITPTKGSAENRLNVNIQRGDVSSLPQSLRETKVPRTVEGQIQGQNKDGSTRILTDEGPVNLRLKGDPPPQGAKVRIEVRPNVNAEQASRGRVDIRVEIPVERATTKATPAQATNTPAPTAKNASTQTQAPTTAPTPNLSAQPLTSQLRGALQAQNLQNTQGLNTNTAPTTPPNSSGNAVSNVAQPILRVGTPLQLNSITTGSTFTSPNLNLNTINTNLPSSITNLGTRGSTSLISALLGLSAPPQNNLQPILAQSFPLTPNSLLASANNVNAQSLLKPLTPNSSPLTQSGGVTTQQPALNIKSPLSTLNMSTIPNATGTTPTKFLSTNVNASILNAPNAISMSGVNTLQSSNIAPIGNSPQQPMQLVLSNASLSLNAKVLSIMPNVPLTTNNMNTVSPAPQFMTSNMRPGQAMGIIQPDVALANGEIRTPITLYSGARQLSGQFFLPANTTGLNAGSQILLDIMNVQTAPNSVAPATAQKFSGLQGLQQLMSQLDFFNADILDMLETIQTEAETSIVNNPALRFMAQAATPSRLTSTILFFMAALKGGDIKQWLGHQNINTINAKQKTELLAKLERSFTTLSRSFAEPTPVQGGEWRSFQMPMLFGLDLSRLQFHIRDYDHDNNTPSEDQERPLKRFIIDFTMSKMGDMQIDSLLMNQRLETILRSDQEFSQTMRQNLRQKYTDIMSNIGYQGHLDFQLKA